MPTAATPIRRALISVADKTGIVEFGRFLGERGVEILSTGGSARALAEAGVAVREVSDYTGFPEIMDGRVKTLHPKIHGGLLARRDSDEHREAMTDYSIAPIDLLVGSLYPFEDVVAGGADPVTAIENIDIGGVAMIRAAAKNHAFVTVVTAPGQYDAVVADMTAHDGATSAALRERLAAAAFARTAAYDSAIAGWFAGQAGETFPDTLSLSGRRLFTLRYGENPHQQAALYRTPEVRPGVVSARQLQGKELSYNNIGDADAAFELVAEFAAPAVVIVKHANPCGVAVADSLAEAYHKALACDPVSAFGGIVAVNRPLDAATAHAVAEIFCEVVIAPEADEAACAALAGRKGLRVLLTGGLPDPVQAGMTLRSVAGGLLLQSRDAGRATADTLQVVTRREPDAREMADLLFGFTVCKYVKSNAIVYAKDGATVGVGAGQMSRVDSARLAARKAAEIGAEAGETAPRTAGSVVASDAFFPFADGLLAAVEAGATAVIQPGGSVRDNEVIEAANAHNIAMVFTGMRHFRH
ncbi:MAG: bifunctional phosphoribosylaminoimidazolecarboxamide formyltransferase/IMP cyclohydrolase [Alphaproteobacteria bacterium]|jgi:phosphoribosylaminoimidazolecarboxamide formyltransferase/IMP cyclohydrolase|nr:bifunctional phosphoribosylaminoimidazolecarboxamide formyltransferase/IMP cyclohydrolase [Alphaproteobacteria bacterium]